MKVCGGGYLDAPALAKSKAPRDVDCRTVSGEESASDDGFNARYAMAQGNWPSYWGTIIAGIAVCIRTARLLERAGNDENGV